jgi:integrase
MTPLRAKMIHDMPLQRLAPRTQEASIAAVAGLAKFSGCSPAHLSPDQMRSSLHHLLGERRLAWSSCNQVACGLTCFSVTTLGWDVLHLHWPPRTGRRLLPHLMSVEALQRLFTSAPTPRHRVVLMTTYAAGLRVGEVVRLQLTDIESDRRLIRVNQGKGRKDRYTLLSTRLLAELRAYWQCYRPSPWLFPAQDRPQPMASASAQKIYSHTQRMAGITHGTGIQTLRHGCATPRLEAGVDLRTMPLLLGHRRIDTTTRSLHITRQHLAKVHSPCDLLGGPDDLPRSVAE